MLKSPKQKRLMNKGKSNLTIEKGSDWGFNQYDNIVLWSDKMSVHEIFLPYDSKRELFLGVLKFVSKEDLHRHIYWDDDLRVFVECSDVFVWGASDLEEIENIKDLELLIKSVKDAGHYGTKLYVARKCGCRPQGAYYTYIDRKHWKLFDECGPEREIGLGNPYKPGEYKYNLMSRIKRKISKVYNKVFRKKHIKH